MADQQKIFADGASYDRRMGRLSPVAGEAFLRWLDLAGGLKWLDVGCGTGAFTSLIRERAAPGAISAVDPSEAQIAFAQGKSIAADVNFRHGDVMALPFDDDAFDVAVMALVIQYVPDRTKAMSELCRVVRPGGTIAAYVWPGWNDGHPLRFLREAADSVGGARPRRPGDQIRTVEALVELFTVTGLDAVEGRAMDLQFTFDDIDDFLTSLPPDEANNMSPADLAQMKTVLKERVPPDADGRITYSAGVNAIRGQVPGS